MAVPKKRTSLSKKRIRRNIWIKKGDLIAIKKKHIHRNIWINKGYLKGYLRAIKTSYLSKFYYMKNKNSESFIKKEPNYRALGFGFFVEHKKYKENLYQSIKIRKRNQSKI